MILGFENEGGRNVEKIKVVNEEVAAVHCQFNQDRIQVQDLSGSVKTELLFLNIQSFRGHHDQLEVFWNTFSQKPAVVALSETWLSENDPIHLYEISGYKKIVTVN